MLGYKLLSINTLAWYQTRSKTTIGAEAVNRRLGLIISHRCSGKGKELMPVPLESAFSYSVLYNTYLSHFLSTLCVNDDAQRPVTLPCSPTC